MESLVRSILKASGLIVKIGGKPEIITLKQAQGLLGTWGWGKNLRSGEMGWILLNRLQKVGI